MKVKFSNPSSGGIAMLGKPRVEIPGNGVTTIVFTCDDSKTEAILAHLKQMYPALKIERGDVDGTAAAAAPSTGKLSLEEFTAVAVVEELSSGWNNVTAAGHGPYKVRNDTTGAKSVIEQAYEKYAADTNAEGE